mmetsp:Transcript_5581/g.16838  ORF Transcript_5581/g.16838 Transcript_5581/m.16838 type:complete len:232 (-) Transcript_5581:180-875(-)
MFRISFWKHDPPNPTEALRNLGPIRESFPMALASSPTSAPVASQMADMALIDETRCARKALAASLESSELHVLVVTMRSFGTQNSYTADSLATAASPSGVGSPPMSTRSGVSRSFTAVPSARNSGLDKIWKSIPGAELAERMALRTSAVPDGTVDFSMMILFVLDTSAIFRAHSSMYLTSAAEPLPRPYVLVGVFTDTKTISASATAVSTSVEKKRFLPRHSFTISSRPGS